MKETSDSLADFLSKFNFKPELAGFIGTEREQFLMVGGGLDGGQYATRAEDFLRMINNSKWTYELSACQVESRTNPQKDLAAIKLEILENENCGNQVAHKLGLHLANIEVASRNMPFTVYPDPRYLEIAKNITQDRLEAACRVTGTHIHLGTRDIDHAIAINNLLVPHTETLCNLGDHLNGERLRLYRTMAENWRPMVYRDPKHLFEVAQTENFTDNPRNCWKLIRISAHGTVELRMFGVTYNVDEIIEWISFVKSITKAVR